MLAVCCGRQNTLVGEIEFLSCSPFDFEAPTYFLDQISAMPDSWLITGASSGLGPSLALAVLRSGHQVVATARNVARAKQSHPEVWRLG